MFVGASRKAQVKDLLAEFDRGAATREQALIVLVGAPGTGKTGAAGPAPHLRLLDVSGRRLRHELRPVITTGAEVIAAR